MLNQHQSGVEDWDGTSNDESLGNLGAELSPDRFFQE